MRCPSCGHATPDDRPACERCGEQRSRAGAPPTLVVGQVAGLTYRVEGFWLIQHQILDFRLLVEDESGNIGRAVPVQMVGMSLEGAVRDGDRVEVPGRWREGKPMRPWWVRNLTTRSLVRRRRWAGFATLPVVLILVLTLAPILWIGTAVIAGGGIDSALRSSRHAVLETLRTHDPCERLPLEVSNARFEMRERLEKYRDIEHALGIQKRIAQWEEELVACPIVRDSALRCDTIAHQIKDLIDIESRWQLPSQVDQSDALRHYYNLRRQSIHDEVSSLTVHLDACMQMIGQR